MAAVAETLTHPDRPKLVAVRNPKEIVAVILADGTVRDLRDATDPDDAPRYSVGSISGPDWILWWDRRSF